LEHSFEIAGHGDLLHWIGELPVFDPDTAGATREIAGNEIHPEAEKVRQVKTILYSAYDLLRRSAPRSEEQIAATNSGIDGDSAGCISSRLHTQFPGGVGIEQITFEDTTLDDHSPSSGDAFAIKR